MASPTPGTGSEGARKAALRSQRLKVALIVFTIFGLPLALMLGYLALREAAYEPPFGDQPGGRIGGRARDEGGAPHAGVRVEVFTQARGGEPRLHQQLATDGSGRFEAEVPPLDGCYVLRVGGGPWVETKHELSLVDDPFPELEFELRPGCELTVALARPGGSDVRGGRYYLTRAGGMLGLPIPSAAVVGDFDGDAFARGGLRPGTWTLAVELADGTKAEWRLRLPAGAVRHRLEL